MTRLEFFNYLYTNVLKKLDCFIEIRSINSKTVKQCFFSEIEKLDSYCNTQKENIYFGVCPRNGDHKITYLTTLWVDIDCGNTGHKKQSIFKDKEVALKFINCVNPKPTIIVDSGNGYHLYWRLNKIYRINTYIKEILKGLSARLHGDTTYDTARIMRVPDTFNIKGILPPVVAKVIEFNNTKYDIQRFNLFRVPLNNTTLLNISLNQERQYDISLLPLKLQKYIIEGKTDQDGYPSRSELDMAVINSLVYFNVSNEEILFIYNNYQIGSKFREQGDRYLKYTVSKARGKGEIKSPVSN